MMVAVNRERFSTRLPAPFAVCFAAAALTGAGYAQTRILQIGIADQQSLEFTANTEVGRARLDTRATNQRFRKGDGINAWIGHSRGTWGEAVRYQEFILENCQPGWTYFLKLKFYWASTPDTGFIATHRGAQVASVVLTPQALGQFWVIPVAARDRREQVQITHIYDLGQDPVHYAQLDHLELGVEGGGWAGDAGAGRWPPGNDGRFPESEIQLVQIGEGDLSSREFQGNAEDPVAVIDLRNPGLLRSIRDFNPWLGHSRGPWGEAVRRQRVRLLNCVPGREYRLKLKFHERSHPATGFSASRNGVQIASVVLDDNALSRYWEIPFVAERSDEQIDITHIYRRGERQLYYASLDYLEVTSVGDSRSWQGRSYGDGNYRPPRRRYPAGN